MQFPKPNIFKQKKNHLNRLKSFTDSITPLISFNGFQIQIFEIYDLKTSILFSPEIY